MPLCLRTKDVDEFVNAVALLAGSFGGINLEDIAAPRCFEIERKLIEKCDIPVFHDDQHGTAIIVAAAVTNALKLTGKKLSELKAVFSGAGAAGTAIFKLLHTMGLRNAVICDRKGRHLRGAVRTWRATPPKRNWLPCPIRRDFRAAWRRSSKAPTCLSVCPRPER